MSDEEMETLGYTGPLPDGKQYRHGTMGAYVTAKCRCPGCVQWSADYGRSRKRRTTGRAEREWSAGWRRDRTEYMGKNTWYRIWTSAVEEAKPSDEEMEALGYTDPLPNGKQYQHGTMGAYVTAKCRCPGCIRLVRR
jgi:hypothetical protein